VRLTLSRKARHTVSGTDATSRYRQPVILAPGDYDAWLSRDTCTANAKALLQRNLDGDLQFYRVLRDVNSSMFEGDPGIKAAFAGA